MIIKHKGQEADIMFSIENNNFYCYYQTRHKKYLVEGESVTDVAEKFIVLVNQIEADQQFWEMINKAARELNREEWYDQGEQ